MTFLTAYLLFGFLVSVVYYVGASRAGDLEWFALLVLAALVGAMWPVTCLACVWSEARH
jgi:hypothetical protein